jgi:hypothetical protein
LGKVRSAASLPPPYQITPPSLAVWRAKPTAYPGHLAGLVVLCRSRTSTPACARRVKNSRSVPAPAAAVHTSRRRAARGRLAPSAAGRLLGLGAGSAPRGGAIRRSGGALTA